MKPMMLAFLTTAVIGVGAYYGLHAWGWSAQDIHSGENVRLN